MQLVKTLSIGADDQPSASYYIYKLSDEEIENLSKQNKGIKYFVSVAKIETYLVDPLRTIYTLYEYESYGVIAFKSAIEECEQWARQCYKNIIDNSKKPFKAYNPGSNSHQLKINFDTYEIAEEEG